MPSPQPSPTGEGVGCSAFCDFGDLKGNLDLQLLISGRLKNKKQPAQPVFLAEPLIPTATPSSLPWERARERATSRKACIGAVRVLGKIAAIWGMPSPQPSPTGEGAGCSGFKYCRSSEKRMPEISTAGIFQAAFIARQMEQTPRAFFRRPLNPQVGCVPQGAHAVGWGCRENGERVRAYRTHLTCGLRLATIREFRYTSWVSKLNILEN